MKKVTMILGLILFNSMVLTSCANNGPELSTPEAKINLSTPEATINTLIKASSEKDKDGLSSCFSKQSAGEFKAIVDKKLSDKDLNDLKEMFGSAKILTSKIEGSKATVSIRLTNRDEEILMAKESEKWVILDF